MEYKKNVSEKETIYFNMNVPGWFKNIPEVDVKCNLIKNLANDLKDEKRISKQEMDKLKTVD